MLKKLFVLALTSGLAAKLYKAYASKRTPDNPAAHSGTAPSTRTSKTQA
ncbi:MAG: hypothetical protein ABI893_13230 [Polaromonas sp.]